MITIIAALATIYMVSNYYNLALTCLFLAVAATGFIFGIVFPLLATRTYDAATVTSNESITLLGIENGERMCYLVQDNDSFDFLWYSKTDGLTLTSAPIGDVSITYQDSTHYAIVESTTSTYHDEWLFLKGSVTTRTDYDYHFFIPRDAVWYPYETN